MKAELRDNDHHFMVGQACPTPTTGVPDVSCHSMQSLQSMQFPHDEQPGLK